MQLRAKIENNLTRFTRMTDVYICDNKINQLFFIFNTRELFSEQKRLTCFNLSETLRLDKQLFIELTGKTDVCLQKAKSGSGDLI